MHGRLAVCPGQAHADVFDGAGIACKGGNLEVRGHDHQRILVEKRGRNGNFLQFGSPANRNRAVGAVPIEDVDLLSWHALPGDGLEIALRAASSRGRLGRRPISLHIEAPRKMRLKRLPKRTVDAHLVAVKFDADAA